MLPKQLKYGNKVESAQARSYRTNIQPQNGTGTYNLGDTIIVNIPTRNNLVLVGSESYFKFNINFTNGATANNALRFDACGAHGIIQRIRIFHGSNLLQDIDQYGLLAKMLFNLQVNNPVEKGKLNVMAGTRNDFVIQSAALSENGNQTGTQTTAGNVVNTNVQVPTAAQVDAAITSALANTVASVTNCNAGDLAFSGLGANAVTSNTYCLNLISLLGTLSMSHYIPLFAITSAPLRIEMQIISNAYQLGCALTAFTPTITNAEYIAEFIELSDSAISMVHSALGGEPLQFVVPDYRDFGYSFAITSGAIQQVSMPIPAKFSSLKSIFVMLRDTSQFGLTFYPYSTISANIQDYQFRVGSQLMPTKAVATTQEQFAELLKAIGSMSDLALLPNIDKVSYNLLQKPAAVASLTSLLTTQSGAFAVGIDMENYAAGSGRDTFFAGYNSNTDDIFCVMDFNSTANVTARFDAFALFDEVIVFQDGTAYVKF